MNTTDAQEESASIVRETRATIEMLRSLTSKLELYNNLLETELSKQQPEEGDNGK